MTRSAKGQRALREHGPGPTTRYAPNVVWLALACMPAVAQEAGASRPYQFTPLFNATTQLTGVSNGAGTSSPLELVTLVSPGFQLSKQSGRVQGTLDYQLQGTLYTRRTEFNRFDNNLSANARAEAIPGWMFVDARAIVARQSLSPLGRQTASDSLAPNDNQEEVLNAQLSPFVRGELRNWADYELRLRGAITEVRGTHVGDSHLLGSVLNLSSPRRGSVLGWGFQASQDSLTFKAGRTTENYRVVASASLTPHPDLVLDLRAGQESTNVVSVQRRTFDNWGGGLRWSPTTRTLFSFSGDRRYFGNGFQVAIEHRLRRSTLRFTSVRDASSSGDAAGVGQPLTLFQLYMRQYQSVEPNVEQRAIRVLELLRLNNQNPNTVVGGGFATSAVSLQRRDDLAYTFIVPRSTFTLRASTGTTEILDNVSAQRGIGFVKQRGLEASAAHRLTPTVNGTLVATYQRNSSRGQPDSDLKSLSANLTSVVNRNLTATAGLRHGVYSGANFSNNDTALTGAVSLRF
jgi:uncharacterized protein (PEP-CTERM system associated)